MIKAGIFIRGIADHCSIQLLGNYIPLVSRCICIGARAKVSRRTSVVACLARPPHGSRSRFRPHATQPREDCWWSVRAWRAALIGAILTQWLPEPKEDAVKE